MPKREDSARFRERLTHLLAQSGLSQTAFATSIGIDRSALSQLLSGTQSRLPRAETLIALAQAYRVPVDWVLGLSDSPSLEASTMSAVETEAALDEQDRTVMERWHSQAAGQKVRYVPALLPDLMRTEAVIAFQARANEQERRRMQSQTRRRLHFSRMPESDIETCMPRQTLELFAAGQGIWQGLPAADRAAQLEHIAATLDELYPAFRLHLFDGRSRYAASMTLFGYGRAALWMGDFYLHIRARPLVLDLARGFDGCIRDATVQSHEVAGWIHRLRVTPD